MSEVEEVAVEDETTEKTEDKVAKQEEPVNLDNLDLLEEIFEYNQVKSLYQDISSEDVASVVTKGTLFFLSINSLKRAFKKKNLIGKALTSFFAASLIWFTPYVASLSYRPR